MENYFIIYFLLGAVCSLSARKFYLGFAILDTGETKNYGLVIYPAALIIVCLIIASLIS